MGTKTILIVEDEKDVQKAYYDTLVRAGYEVQTATNGQGGLLAIRRQAPQLILLDLYMPNMNGLTMLQQLRQQPDNRTIPVIVLTNSGDLQDLASSLTALAAAYLIKAETSLSTLLGAVKDLIGPGN